MPPSYGDSASQIERKLKEILNKPPSCAKSHDLARLKKVQNEM